MKTILIFLVIVLFSFEVTAQSAGSIGLTNARSAAMGRTYTAGSEGLGGLGTNPATIFNRKDSTRKWEIITVFPIPQLAVRTGTNFFTIDEFNYFFGENSINANGDKVGKHLTADDKSRLTNLFSEGGTFQTDLQTTLFAISFKPSAKAGVFTFGISDVMGVSTTIPKGLIDLVFNGNTLVNDSVGTVFDFGDTKLQAWWLRKYSLSWAHGMKFLPKVFKEFNYGFSLNIISGFFYVGLDKMNSQFTTSARNTISIKNDFMAHSSFSPDFGVSYDFDSSGTKSESSPGLFPSPAGSGFGLDFGFWGKINDVWAVGLSFTDLGSVKWKEHVAELQSTADVVITSLNDTAQTNNLGDRLLGKKESKFIDAISTPLPAAMHIGVSFQLDKFVKGYFPGKMLIVAGYNQGFNDQLRNSKTPRVSVGAEWIPRNWILSFRTGFSFGGFTKFGWGAGAGLDFGFLELNGGTPDFHYLFMPNGAKRISFAIDSKWKF